MGVGFLGMYGFGGSVQLLLRELFFGPFTVLVSFCGCTIECT
jgi:hypothetical protein